MGRRGRQTASLVSEEGIKAKPWKTPGNAYIIKSARGQSKKVSREDLTSSRMVGQSPARELLDHVFPLAPSLLQSERPKQLAARGAAGNEPRSYQMHNWQTGTQQNS